MIDFDYDKWAENTQKRIKAEEGFSRAPYYDPVAKKKTIGWGFNLEDPATRDILKRNGGNFEKAFQERFKLAEQDAKRLIPNLDEFPASIREAAVDMAYNMGLNTYAGFHKHLEGMNTRDWRKAADELMDSKYARQLPDRSQRNYELLMSQLQMEIAD